MLEVYAAGPVTDEAAAGLEVATETSDPLRALVRISGTVTTTTLPLLGSVLRTHLAGGRRYLRVDLATACLSEDIALAPLVEIHDVLTGLGGLLTFETDDPAAGIRLTAAGLFLRPS